jgi:cell division protease FtsH
VSHALPEEGLPLELTPFAAVEAAYPAELARIAEALRRGLSVLVEADKELTPFLYKAVRDRLKREGRSFLYLDGRPQEGAGGQGALAPTGAVGTMLAQLREAVRGAMGRSILVLPHLDLLTSSSGGLTQEAREVIPLLYENPDALWLGFKDPSFPVPRVIEALFPHREPVLGIPRDRLAHVVTQRESRKFGRGLRPYRLYSHVSGLNAVRLRRLLASVSGEDYPADPGPAYAQLRSGTLTGNLKVPEVDLARDIAGYGSVKRRLQQELLDVLAHKERLADPEAVRRVESLLPRGMIFWGPPGTGKTLFAKAMARALGAAVSVVSGPELKSRWVGESEENLRQLFVRARQAAPSVIIFDELDSFASARGTYTGSGVEHSMVNQLLTEMDGFRREELVFVVGTTNLVESLDPALLRPGRFEFQLHVPYPNASDRRAILSLYDEKWGLGLDARALDYAVKRTGERVEGTGTPYSGDHLQALGRTLARRRLREGREGATDALEVETALSEWLQRPELTPTEERVVATHEAGHAVCALFCPHAPPIDRISIRGDLAGALGFVAYADRAHRHVVTRNQLLDSVCVLFGGREAEALLMDDVSAGAASDLERATGIARALVEELGLGPEELGLQRFVDGEGRPVPLADATRGALDRAVHEVLVTQRRRARALLEQQRPLLVALRDLLLERKVLDREAFRHLC